MKKKTVLRIARVLIVVSALVAGYLLRGLELDKVYNEGFDYGWNCAAEADMRAESVEAKQGNSVEDEILKGGLK